MNRNNVLTVVAAAAVALFAQGAFAQSTSRPEVKADTKAAAKAGDLPSAGENPRPVGENDHRGKATKSKMHQGSRMQHKSKTRSEEKAGELKPAGENARPVGESSMHTGKAGAGTMSDKTRMQRKSQTRSDKASGELHPAGENARPLNAAEKK